MKILAFAWFLTLGALVYLILVKSLPGVEAVTLPFRVDKSIRAAKPE